MSIRSMLVGNIDALLAASRPRLVRQAHMYGVTPDMVDDVVQEALLEAWRHLAALRDVESFEAWLSGILRNVCLRWSRTQSIVGARQVPLVQFEREEDADANAARERSLPEPAILDPAEELNRQDMQVLLDRALAHLPSQTREAVALYYRSEAESFGLQVDQENAASWRETRELCRNCGHHRQRGLIESRDGLGFLQTRCPACSAIYGNTSTSGWMPELYGLHSFRPAIKRVEATMRSSMPQSLANGCYPCRACGKPARLRTVTPGESLCSLRV